MAVHLIPPLDYSQILDIEAAEKNRSLRVKKGNWQHFAACPPPAKAPVAYGPRLPTADERLSGLNEEDLTLHDLAKVFRPSVANVEPTWQEPVLKTLMAAPGIDVNAGAYSYGWHGSHVRMTPLGMAIISEIEP
eukprot:s471_g7.t1